jgi:hypothetical protein
MSMLQSTDGTLPLAAECVRQFAAQCRRVCVVAFHRRPVATQSPRLPERSMKSHSIPRLLAVMLALPWMLGPAGAQILAVPPYTPPNAVAAPPAAAAALLLPDSATVHRIALVAPSAAEAQRVNLKSARVSAGDKSATKRRRKAVGFARALPSGESVLRLADLPWQNVEGGLRAARVSINSPGAAGLRVGIALVNAPPGLVLRFRGSAPGALAYGPDAAAQLIAGSLFWTPLLDGDTAVIELAMPQAAALGGATIDLPLVSHLAVTTAALKQGDPLGNIGASDPCEYDVACVAAPLQQQAASAIKATARILLVDGGDSWLCTGTLINDSANSTTPYLYTANHCIDNGGDDPGAAKGQPAAAAQTIETFWLFQTNLCGADSGAHVNFSELTSGATLLARGVDFDWALVRLNSPPPSGVTFAAWNASGPLAAGLAANGIHHPEGDLKKFSQGSTQSYVNYSDHSSYIQMMWAKGVTEPGSSGSGLFTLDATNSFLELRGGLWGGDSMCSAPRALDQYSRLDVALPLISPYLTPAATNAARTVPAVEFYHAGLDDYFVTASPSEIQDLDNGVHAGWVRTGLRFLVYTDPAAAPAGVQPVCRFYVAPAYGDSHFYSASPAECAATAQKFKAQWVYESPAVFYIALPDAASGACPTGSRGIFRFLNAANGLHHRYTAEVDVRDSIISDGGWIQEGYGTPPDSPVMCTPTS